MRSRERAGWSQKEIDATTVGDVWRELDLGDEPDGLLYAVNKEYAPKEPALADGDTVALIPPVSGGAFLLSDSTVSLDEVVGEVASGEAGAIATFSGTAPDYYAPTDWRQLDQSDGDLGGTSALPIDVAGGTPSQIMIVWMIRLGLLT